MTPPAACDLVLPCRDEAAALTTLLPTIPDVFHVIVVDNGSRDRTAEVARELGATVVEESTPGYGAAVHAGLLAATHEHVAFMDGDGSFDPAELLGLLDDVAAGRADLAVGRRRPVRGGVWPWHARAGNALIVAWLRRRISLDAHDIAPMRVCRRRDLLELDVRDRRFGYPVELLAEGHPGRVAVRRARRRVPPPGGGDEVQGLGVGARDAAHRARLLEGPVVTGAEPVRMLVVAKAPVPGQVKTRLGADIGMAAAAELAAAALLDTLAACTEAVGPQRCHLSLAGDVAGDLAGAVEREALAAALAGWTVTPQHGDTFAARLVAAHHDVPGPVVQIGMDTPQVTSALLLAAAAGLAGADAVLGPAPDGGWWVLALRDPSRAAPLLTVPMSTPTTYDETRAALETAGLRVGTTTQLRDVDTVADARLVSEAAPGTRFARVWASRVSQLGSNTCSG